MVAFSAQPGHPLARAAAVLGFVVFLTVGGSPILWSAEPELVGILALAVETDVAEKLGLSPETHQALVNLVDRREAEATNLVLETRSLPPAERAQRLVPFVQESERLGLALLNPQQQMHLRQLRISRQGLVTLGEADVAQQLNLTDEQKTQVQTVLQERAVALAQRSEEEQALARNEYERRLRSVLTDAQMTAWQKMAGLLEAGDQVAQAPAPTTDNPPPTESSPAEPPAREKEPSPPVAPDDESQPAPMPEQPAAPQAAPQQPAPAQPMAEQPEEATQPLAPTADGDEPREDVRLKFNFRYAPWKDVIEWFAMQANLSLEGEAPLGTFNYTDNRSYTPAEALDLLNSVLLTKGYTLMRRDRLLFVVNLEDLQDGIPPNLVTRITPEELDERGEYEIVSVLFPLVKMTPEQAEAELRPLLGRPSELIVLPLSKQVRVTGTAGNLKTIRRVIQAVDNPESAKDLNKFPVEHVSPEELLNVARKLMGIPADADGAEDGSIRFTADPLSNNIYVSGQPDMIQRFEQILKLVDVESNVTASGPGALESSQLEVYPITDADPTSVLQVMQTLLAGLPGVRLATDPLTGNLIALAKPAEHATIKATLAQLQKETRQVTVLRLRRLDPQLAVVSINRMFGGGTEGNVDPKAPVVDADPTSGILLIRGSQTQVTQIKDLLQQMGETPETLEGLAASDALGTSPGLGLGKIRVLPYTGREARDLLEQAELLWPTMGKNRIRVIRSGASINSRRWSGEAPPYEEDSETPDAVPAAPGRDTQETAPRPADQPADREAAWRRLRAGGIRKTVVGGAQPSRRLAVAADVADVARLLSQPTRPSAESPIVSGPKGRTAQFAVERYEVAQVDEPLQADEPPAASPPPATSREPRPNADAEIIVKVTPNGLIIASDDEAALDQFEMLIRELYDTMPPSGSEFTVFYLKYIQAAAAADLLTQLITGVAPSEGTGGGGGLMGSLASAALGNVGGGLVSDLLSGGGGSTSTFSSTGLSIVAESRLNALVVQGSPEQIDMVEQLLTVIDQESSPELVQTLPPPRMIPVFNTSADAIATTVRNIYAQQIASGGGQQRQPSPEDFIRALRGDRGGRGGGNRPEPTTQMTISVDARSNSLVVSAPDPLFQSVKTLVEALDQPGLESPQVTEVVSISGANATSVKNALTAVLGDVIKSGTTTTSTGQSSGNAQQTSETPRQPSSDDFREQMRQRFEMFNNMQRGGGSPFGGRSFGGFGGGDRDGGDRSGRSRGGRGGGF